MKSDFKHEDILLLKSYKSKGSVTTAEVNEIEMIWQSIDPSYNMCKTCRDIIVNEFARLVKLVEANIGMPITEYTGEVVSEKASTVSFTESDLQSMTAQEIIDMVYEKFELDMGIPKNQKQKIIKKALKLISNE